MRAMANWKGLRHRQRDEEWLMDHLKRTWHALTLVILRVVFRVLELSQLPIRSLLCFFSLHVFCSHDWISPPLLPRIGRDKHKLTVVLDLDETLISAYDSAVVPPGFHARAVKAGLKWFQLQCLGSNKDSNGKVRVNNVTVYERPGLQEFLTRTKEFAELVLFTAALEGYAKPLIDTIDRDNLITARLYRQATVTTRYSEHVKDLSRLGRSLKRTVLIDNSPGSFLLQPSNGIPCVPFTAEDVNDSQLLDVVLPLLQHLSGKEDVRPVLQERYQMAAWFVSRGIKL